MSAFLGAAACCACAKESVVTFEMIYIDLLAFAYIECDTWRNRTVENWTRRLWTWLKSGKAGFTLNMTNLASRDYERFALIGTWRTFLLSNVLKWHDLIPWLHRGVFNKDICRCTCSRFQIRPRWSRQETSRSLTNARFLGVLLMGSLGQFLVILGSQT